MNKKYQVLILCVFLILSSSCGSNEASKNDADEEIDISSSADVTGIDVANESNTENSTDNNKELLDELEKIEPPTAAEIYANATPKIDYENSPQANPVIYSARLNGYYLDITTEGFIFRYDMDAPGNGCRYLIVGDIVPEGEYSIHITNLIDYDSQKEYGYYPIYIADYMDKYYRQKTTYRLGSDFQILYDIYSYGAEDYLLNEEVDREIIKEAADFYKEWEEDYNEYHYYGLIHDNGNVTEVIVNEDGTVDGINGSDNELLIYLEEGQQLMGNNVEFIPTDPSIFDPVDIIDKILVSEEAAKSKIAINEKLKEQELDVSAYYYSLDSTLYQDSVIISGSIFNYTTTDIKDINIAFLAWDYNGLPLKISELNSEFEDYVLEKEFEGINIASDDYVSLKLSMDYNTNIRAITAIWVSYTDFYGNTYENPLYQEFLDEYEAKPNK